MQCPECGTIQPDTDEVCDACGARLQENRRTAGTTGDRTDKVPGFQKASQPTGEEAPSPFPLPGTPSSGDSARMKKLWQTPAEGSPPFPSKAAGSEPADEPTESSGPRTADSALSTPPPEPPAPAPSPTPSKPDAPAHPPASSKPAAPAPSSSLREAPSADRQSTPPPPPGTGPAAPAGRSSPSPTGAGPGLPQNAVTPGTSHSHAKAAETPPAPSKPVPREQPPRSEITPAQPKKPTEEAESTGPGLKKCDECQRPFPSSELQIARGQRLCPECRSRISDSILRKVQEETGAQKVLERKVSDAVPARVESTSRDVPRHLSGAALAYAAWPDAKLDIDQETFRAEWKRTRGEMTSNPPLKETRFPFGGTFMSVMVVTGIALLGGAVAVNRLLPSHFVLTLLWLVMGFGGIAALFMGIDSRSTLVVNNRGLWKEALLSGKRVFWPMMEAVQVSYKPLAGMGFLYASLNIEVRTKEKKTTVFSIPCLAGTPAVENFDELKRQVAAGAKMVGARLS